MTVVNAVWKVNYGKAPDKSRAATTCGLFVCCLSGLPEKATADESLLPGSYRQDHASGEDPAKKSK